MHNNFAGVSGAKSRRVRYIDDFSGNLRCYSVFLEMSVQKVNRFNDLTISSGNYDVIRSYVGS